MNDGDSLGVTSTGVLTGRAYSDKIGAGVWTVDNQGRMQNSGSAILSTDNSSGYARGYDIKLTNTGTIEQTGAGPAIYMRFSFFSDLTNRGIIATRSAEVISAYNTAVSVANFGTISNASSTTGAGGYAIMAVGYSQLYLYNEGRIEGSIYAPVPGTFYNMSGATIAGSVLINTSTFHNFGLIAGNLEFFGSPANVVQEGTIYGNVALGTGSDVFDNSSGIVLGYIYGSGGADKIIGSTRSDTIYGDYLNSPTVGSNDTLLGGGGDDLLVGGGGDDVLSGDADNDILYGDGGNDRLDGGQGEDRLFGGDGADVIHGGYGRDVAYGGFGADVIYGNQDDDVLYGNQDNDWLHGGQGNDTLFGGQNNDTLNGGVGDDVLYGNLGDDLFVFSSGFGHDVVGDFGVGADRIRFEAGTFADFADLQARMTQASDGVLLTDAAGDTLLIVGATTGGLTAAQFIFG